MKQEYFREQVFQIACGCAQPNISAEQIDSISILKPNDVILNQFNKLCEPLLELQSENYLQIEELTKQRDDLLPLLMNGQVSVNSDLSVCINLIIRTTTRICSYSNDLFWSYLRIVFL